jgi:Tfp pilus assembly protein PilO
MAAPRSFWQIDAVGIGACLAACAAWYFLGLRPLSEAKEHRIALSAELTARQGRLADLEKSLAAERGRLARLASSVSDGQVQLKTLESLNERLASLGELASECDLRVDEIKPGSAAPLRHYTAVPIRLAGTGAFPQAAIFFHSLQERFRDVGVAGFDLKGEPEATDKPPTFSIQLLWYAAPDAAAAKGARP